MRNADMPELKIRDALPEDAVAACEVLRRSIAELCVADHGNDPKILQQWLANKTPKIVASWIAQEDSSLLVAIEDGKILGVGLVNDNGEIGLNYVSPDARFRGISKCLLQALELRAAQRANKQCTLTSTETARRFYRANGYLEIGAPEERGMKNRVYRMSKLLAIH